jgi:hypothetical protein
MNISKNEELPQKSCRDRVDHRGHVGYAQVLPKRYSSLVVTASISSVKKSHTPVVIHEPLSDRPR